MNSTLKKYILLAAALPAFIVEANDIVLDGEAKEQVWSQGTPVELTQIQYPFEKDTLLVGTRARILPMDNHLYITVTAEFEGELQAYLNPLDNIPGDEDAVQVIIRPYSNGGDAYVFEFNGKGSKQDGIWPSRDTSVEHSWDGDWELATNINGNNYTAELKIPYSNFNFDDSGTVDTWQIGFKRQYPNEKLHVITNYVYKNNQECEICSIGKVPGFSGAKQDKTLFLKPALVYRSSKSEYDGEKDQADKLDPSLEVEWKPSSNSNLNVGFNVDYSGSDIDALQIDVNAPFALYFEENRSTFTRDSEVFNSQQSLIYTRNIISPEMGVKYTSQSDEQDVGVFYFKDDLTSYIVPGAYYSDSAYRNTSSDNFAAKYSRKSEDGMLSVLSTVRESEGYSNTVLSLGGAWYINENNEITLDVSSSQTDDEYFGLDNDDGQYAYLTYYLTGEDWSLYAEASMNDSFRSDLGFNAYQDRTSLYALLDKTYVFEGNEWVYDATFSVGVQRDSHIDGKTIEDARSASVYLTLPNSGSFNYELLSIDTSPFEDDNSIISVLSHTASFVTNPTDEWEMYGSYTFGDWVDYINEQKGDNTIYTFGNTYQISESSDVFLDIKYDEMLTPGGDNVFGYWQYDFGVKYQVNDYSYLKVNGSHYQLTEYAYGEYDSDNTVLQAIYVYNFNNQVEFSMGMVEDRNEATYERELYESLDTRYFIKYTQTFSF